MKQQAAVEALARACLDAGGHAWVVGGSVRDQLLGRASKDVDVEVHGIDAQGLADLLGRLGRVNEVGRSFGVFKLRIGRWTLDVSLPRRDSNAGPGHRGIQVEGDPHMGLVEAARRRDLTINAMMLDPLTQELLDPFGGQADLVSRTLRAVDAESFLDDPLRALRVVQFAGRFAFRPDPELVALCRDAPLDELPAERIWGELEKLLQRSPQPSVGLQVGRDTRVLPRILPEVAGVAPGLVDAAVDRAAAARKGAGPAPRPLALMLGALLAELPLDLATAELDRLNVQTRQRYPLRVRVLGAVAHWREVAAGTDDTFLRTLAERHEVGLICRVAAAASGSPVAASALQRSMDLGIDQHALPTLLHGRDLGELGLAPGPDMGLLLAQVRGAQLEGRLGSRADALAYAARLLAERESDQEPT